MIVLNKLNHSDEQWVTLAQIEDDGTVYMTNLFKFRERAEYPDGRASDLTGIQAYQLYGVETAKLIESIGGKIIHSSMFFGMVVGEVEDLWDAIAIVEYPSISAFMQMVESDAWQQHAIHREAGLEGQLNIVSKIPPE